MNTPSAIKPAVDGPCAFEVTTHYRVTPAETGAIIDYPRALDDYIRRHVWLTEASTGGGKVLIQGCHISVKQVSP